MDHNHIDDQLIDKPRKHQRPHTYLQTVIEAKSNKITTYKFYYTPPSIQQTLQLLKKALIAASGDELQRGKIQKLVVDDGIEFNNTMFKLTVQSLGIQIYHSPSKSPDSKARIERTFTAMNRQSVHTLPGTILSTPIDRNNDNLEGKAIYTIETFHIPVSE